MQKVIVQRTPSTEVEPRPTPPRPGRGKLVVGEVRALLPLAAPIIVSQLGGVGMNVMDTLMIGPLGAEALAALGLANAIHMSALILCMGDAAGNVATGLAGVRGRGSGRSAVGCWCRGSGSPLRLSAPVVAVSLFGEPIARMLGQPPAVAELAGGYLWALAAGIPAFLFFTAFRQFLEGMSLTRPAMLITFVGLAVNYGGNRALIYGVGDWVPALGVVGSGWSTTLVRLAMLAAMAGYLFWNPTLHPFRGIGWRFRWPLFRRITIIGVPAGAQLGMEVGFFAFCAVMMGWFGALELGTHQITINIASTTFMVALGTSIAGSIRVGQRIGAGDADGVRGATVATYGIVLASMATFALFFLLVPTALIRLYTGDPEILGLGTSLLGIAALFQIFDGAQVAGVCVLRGAADTRVPTLLVAIAYWMIGVPMAYWLGFHSPLGPVGIWMGIVIALAVAAMLLALRVRRVVWKRTPARATAT